MLKTSLPFVLVASICAVPRPAGAQTIEVGGGVGGVSLANGGDFWGEGLRSAVADGRVTVPLTPRFGLEIFATYGQRSWPMQTYGATVTGGGTDRTESLIGVVIKQRLRSSSSRGFHAFVTYGLAGYYAKNVSAASQASYANGNTYTYPQSTRTQHEDGFPILGFGVEKQMGPHVAVRGEVQALMFLYLPIGVRGSFGVSIPVGGHF
jgi:hypothetical protein